MRIEVLAKNFGVTKGSFYWHFKDRQDLFDAVLQTWRDGRIRDIEKQSVAIPGSEQAQLLHLIDVYGATRNPQGGFRSNWRYANGPGETLRLRPLSRRSIPGVSNARGSCLSPSAFPRKKRKAAVCCSTLTFFGQSLMACESYDPRCERVQALDR
jgi:AcrR family transcriptional regulator